MRIPKANQVIFRAVVSYEKYCRRIAEQLFAEFVRRTNDENTAEDLTTEAIKELALPVMETEL